MTRLAMEACGGSFYVDFYLVSVFIRIKLIWEGLEATLILFVTL